VLNRTKGYAPKGDELTGKVALVTGAGRGLGLTTAEAYLAAGARVAILDRDAAALEGALAELAAEAFEPLPIHADVRREEDVDHAINATLRAFGKLDVLVNNAAVLMTFIKGDAAERPRFWELEPDRWRELWEINVTGTWLCASRAAREMIAAGGGSIINVTTSRGTMSSERHIPYGPSKAAITAFTRAGAKQLKAHRVRMNALLPGAAANRRGEANPGLNAWDVMVPAAIYLASDASASVTGQSIIADEYNRSRGLPAPYVAAGD
jgi:NAD(P)-dependent dehydrogenase (short-subunit alcohol dehydrogenase family)